MGFCSKLSSHHPIRKLSAEHRKVPTLHFIFIIFLSQGTYLHFSRGQSADRAVRGQQNTTNQINYINYTSTTVPQQQIKQTPINYVGYTNYNYTPIKYESPAKSNNK